MSEELWENAFFHISLFEAEQVNLLTLSKTELESQWRDALSGQSCELSAAKANEVAALGNAEVGGDSTSQGEVRVSVSRLILSTPRRRGSVLFRPKRRGIMSARYF